MSNLTQTLNRIITDRKAVKLQIPQETPEQFQARIDKAHRELQFKSYQMAGSMSTVVEDADNVSTAVLTITE